MSLMPGGPGLLRDDEPGGQIVARSGIGEQQGVNTHALLQDLSIILNLHQDIADELHRSKPDLGRIRRLNEEIGEAVMRQLPE